MFWKFKKSNNNNPDYEYYDLEKERQQTRKELLNELDDKVGDENWWAIKRVSWYVDINDWLDKAECYEDIERLKRKFLS